MVRKMKKRPFTIAFCAVIAIIFAYKLFGMVGTTDYKNGWKHQIGHFGVCDLDNSGDCSEARHRIQSATGSYIAGSYCEEHWKSYGADFFKKLIAVRDSNNSSNSNNSSEANNAKICAEKAVKDMLRAPKTAEFCSYTEMIATNLGDNRWEVSGYVDAENSFGALLRQNWTVRLTLIDTGFKDYTVDFS